MDRPMDFVIAACDKLQHEYKEHSFSGTKKVVAKYTLDALVGFCRQNAEFAQAIAQCDKSFADCIKHVLDGHGSCISDIDAYRKAVSFYFEGADVIFEMKICLCSSEQPANEGKKAIILDLFSGGW